MLFKDAEQSPESAPRLKNVSVSSLEIIGLYYLLADKSLRSDSQGFRPLLRYSFLFCLSDFTFVLFVYSFTGELNAFGIGL